MDNFILIYIYIINWTGGIYSYCLELKIVLGTNLKQGWVPVFVTWNQRKYWVLNLGGGGTLYFCWEK